MVQLYQEHRRVFIEALRNAQIRYRDDAIAGLASGAEIMNSLQEAMAGKGGIRLFKYQPFSERNLRDCEAGVLHLSKLNDLNDVNEGRPLFSKASVEHSLCNLNIDQISSLDLGELPAFVRSSLGDEGLELFGKMLKQKKESGLLESTIAPSIADTLKSLTERMRDTELCGSLSATERSASMWDRYGDGHRGFAIGYSLDRFTTGLTVARGGSCAYGLNALIAPVYYGERYDMSYNSSTALVHDPALIGPSNSEVLFLALSLLQKAKEWECEQEWRVISFACNPEASVHYCKMEPESIYLGLRMQEDERERVVGVARKNGWKVYEMAISEDSLDWTLEVNELEDM